jgi:hypothetical protein
MKLRLIATVLAANLVAITAAIALDANLPAYQAVSGISGQIKSVGSDTLNNEMALWAKGFEGQYPGVTIEIEGKVSATAPPALRVLAVSRFLLPDVPGRPPGRPGPAALCARRRWQIPALRKRLEKIIPEPRCCSRARGTAAVGREVDVLGPR